MPFNLELSTDLSARLGMSIIKLDAVTYPAALRRLADEYPVVHNLLINSKGELRQTIRCSIQGQIINDDTPIPADAQVKLFFIHAGG